MATEQELNRAKEIAAIEKERLRIKEKQNDLDSESVGLASSLVDSIKVLRDQLLTKTFLKLTNKLTLKY